MLYILWALTKCIMIWIHHYSVIYRIVSLPKKILWLCLVLNPKCSTPCTHLHAPPRWGGVGVGGGAGGAGAGSFQRRPAFLSFVLFFCSPNIPP